MGGTDKLNAAQVEGELARLAHNLRHSLVGATTNDDELPPGAIEHESAVMVPSVEASEEASNQDSAGGGFVSTCSCGRQFREDQRFCRGCGKERQPAQECTACGAFIDAEETACKKCGEPVSRKMKN